MGQLLRDISFCARYEITRGRHHRIWKKNRFCCGNAQNLSHSKCLIWIFCQDCNRILLSLIYDHRLTFSSLNLVIGNVELIKKNVTGWDCHQGVRFTLAFERALHGRNRKTIVFRWGPLMRSSEQVSTAFSCRIAWFEKQIRTVVKAGRIDHFDNLFWLVNFH